MTRREEPVGARTSATGAIYDLGYRSYDGPRLGRPHAVATLYRASLRQIFGFGRSGRAKIIPWGVTAFAVIPAAVAAAISALVPVGEASPFNYDNYLWGMQSLIAIFVAAQAPEIVSSDQRHHVLSLYFSHALKRTDYALAKWGALATAIAIMCVIPMLVIFLGAVLAASDVPAAFGDQVGNLPKILGAPLIYAIPLAGLGLAIAAYTPRRMYASGAIIAVFIVTAAVAGILAEATTGTMSKVGPLVSPFVAIDGARDWLVGATITDSPVGATGIALPVFGLLTLAIATIGLGVVLWRYQSVDA
jgi:ABC-2 type transport system permease protein